MRPVTAAVPIRRRGVKRGPPLGPHPPPAPVKVSDGKSGTQRLRRRSQRRGSLFPNGRRPGGHLDGARGWMPAIWRPNVSRVLPDVDVEVGVTEHASSKGTKRKRAPRTKGPWQHGVKYRSHCKVCSACPHGKSADTAAVLNLRVSWLFMQRVRWVSNLRARSSPLSVQGVRWWWRRARSASTVVYALIARSAVGLNLRARSSALSLQGVRRVSICEHGRQRSKCKECGGASICEHGRRRSRCKECGGSAICEHGRQRSKCNLRSAARVGGICEHGRIRSQCKECGGGSICEHVVALSARSAVGLKSASTVVTALSARSAVGLESASTVVYALLQGVRWGVNLRARSSAQILIAVDLESASTVVYALSARSVAPRINESRDECAPPARRRRPSLPAVPRQELLLPPFPFLLAVELLQRRAPLLLALPLPRAKSLLQRVTHALRHDPHDLLIVVRDSPPVGELLPPTVSTAMYPRVAPP